MRLTGFLLILLFLCGCQREAPVVAEPPPVETVAPAPEPAPVPEPEPEPKTTALDLTGPYIFCNGGRYKVIDRDGRVILDAGEDQVLLCREQYEGPARLLQVKRSEGVVETQGWVQPEKSWSDIYDLEGNFLSAIPLEYLQIYGDLACGYNREAQCSQLWNWKTGALVHDRVGMVVPVDDCIAMSREDNAWILDRQGNLLRETPMGYRLQNAVGPYLAVDDGKGQGLMDLEGNLVLDCTWQYIQGFQGPYLLVQEETGTVVLDGETFEVLCRPGADIQTMAQGAYLARSNIAGSRLWSLDGTLLLNRVLKDWVPSLDVDGDGLTDLFAAETYDQSCLLCFDAQGTVLWEMERAQRQADYGLELLSATGLLFTGYAEGEDGLYRTITRLIDLTTGETKTLLEDSGGYCYHIGDTALFREEPNDLGWYRTSLLDMTGEVLVEDLKFWSYVDENVIQARKGFTVGLLTLDGVWLYQESAFGTVNDT